MTTFSDFFLPQPTMLLVGLPAFNRIPKGAIYAVFYECDHFYSKKFYYLLFMMAFDAEKRSQAASFFRAKLI